MKKLRSHLVILSISLLCPVMLIGGSYLLDSHHRVMELPEEIKSEAVKSPDLRKENDSTSLKGLSVNESFYQ